MEEREEYRVVRFYKKSVKTKGVKTMMTIGGAEQRAIVEEEGVF